MDLAKESELILMTTPITMGLKQALTLAALVLEFELENCQPEATEWAYDVQQARQVISQVITRPDPGEFFTSAPTRHRAGRKSNQIINP